MNKIKIYYFWNLNQKELLTNYFLPTFTQYNGDDFELIGEEFENDHEITTFGSVGFKKVIIRKVNSIINILEKTNENEFFVVSDIDIQFFGSITNTILEAINLDRDIVFQKEASTGNDINTGFMLVKSNDTTKQFWKTILGELVNTDERLFINEQALANRMLGNINSSTFDSTIWNWSQGNLTKNIILHHANCVGDLNGKIEQLNNVKEYIMN